MKFNYPITFAFLKGLRADRSAFLSLPFGPITELTPQDLLGMLKVCHKNPRGLSAWHPASPETLKEKARVPSLAFFNPPLPKVQKIRPFFSGHASPVVPPWCVQDYRNRPQFMVFKNPLRGCCLRGTVIHGQFKNNWFAQLT